MKNKIFYAVIAIAFIVIAAISFQSCGSKKEEEKIVTEKEAYNNTEKSDAKATSTPTEAGSMDKNESRGKGESTTSIDNDQLAKEVPSQNKQIAEKIPTKIIKQADVNFQVKNMEDSRKAILVEVKKSGGYISSENQTNKGRKLTKVID